MSYTLYQIKSALSTTKHRINITKNSIKIKPENFGNKLELKTSVKLTRTTKLDSGNYDSVGDR